MKSLLSYIYSGTPTELDAEDLAVLQGKALPASD
jgi:hypothetical protein